MANPLLSGDAVGRITAPASAAQPPKTGLDSSSATRSAPDVFNSASPVDTVELSPEAVRASQVAVSRQSREVTSQVAPTSDTPFASNGRINVGNSPIGNSARAEIAVAAANEEAARTARSLDRKVVFRVDNGRISASVIESGAEGTQVVTQVPPAQIQPFADIAKQADLQAKLHGDAVGLHLDSLA